MDIYGQQGNSIPQKMVLIFLEVIILICSYWLLFENGYEKIFGVEPDTNGNQTRHIILFAFNCMVFVRMLVTMLYLLKRKIPWEETFSIPFAFALYYIGFILLGYQTETAIDIIDILGILLFITGSVINTLSELLRDKWKKYPENKGKLYTKGLFRHSMHINYFGDLLWVSAYAILTRNWYSVSIPILLFCFFAFYNIPRLDEYLASKYGKAFEAYRQRTKKLIPFIY